VLSTYQRTHIQSNQLALIWEPSGYLAFIPHCQRIVEKPGGHERVRKHALLPESHHYQRTFSRPAPSRTGLLSVGLHDCVWLVCYLAVPPHPKPGKPCAGACFLQLDGLPQFRGHGEWQNTWCGLWAGGGQPVAQVNELENMERPCLGIMDSCLVFLGHTVTLLCVPCRLGWWKGQLEGKLLCTKAVVTHNFFTFFHLEICGHTRFYCGHTQFFSLLSETFFTSEWKNFFAVTHKIFH